jgi:hypothetical protein
MFCCPPLTAGIRGLASSPASGIRGLRDQWVNDDFSSRSSESRRLLLKVDGGHLCRVAIKTVGTGGAGHDADNGGDDQSEQDIHEGFVGTMH